MTGPAAEPGAEQAEPLHRRLVSGIAWTGTASMVTQLVSWLSTLVVARLLTDTDYGIMGMAGVYVAAAQLVNEFGLGAAVVARRDLDRDAIARIAGFSLLAGALFAGIAGAVAWPIGFFFQEPRVVGVIAVLGAAFVLTGLRAVPYALLARNMRFKAIAAVDTAEALVQVTTTVMLAVGGAGYWSLALGVIAGRLTGTVAALLLSPHPIMWPTPYSTIASAIRFGAEVVLSRLVWYWYTTADTVILGRRLGSAALGDYAMAASLASVPVSKTYTLYEKATSAVFAAGKHDLASLRNHIVTLFRAISIVTFPLSIGLALTARPFVLVVLGHHWEAAILPLQLLAIAAAFRSLDPVLAQLLIYVGRVSLTTRVSLGAAIVLPLLFLAGARYGPGGVAAAWVIGHPLVVLLHFLLLVRRVVAVKISQMLLALWPAVSGVGVMTAAVMVTLHTTRAEGEVVRLVAGVSVGAVAYIATLLIGHRAALRDMVSWTRHGAPAGEDS